MIISKIFRGVLIMNKSTSRSKKNISIQVSDLFQLSATKAQDQQFNIIEAAIKSFAKNGIEGTTYTQLAKDCNVSRPLVHHYFPSLDDLFLLTAKYVRMTLLKCATDEMGKAVNSSPKEQLLLYIQGCFNWIRLYQDQCSFWFLYYYQASRLPMARKENTVLVAEGHLRIKQLLDLGNNNKFWSIKNTYEKAKLIQITITGGMISTMSEDGYLSTDVAEKIVKNAIENIMLSKT